MKRPTIPDVAKEAGVSVSTVNRIMAGSSSVRDTTILRVQEAAERLGYHGLGSIETVLRKSAPSYRFGFLLQQSNRELYQIIGREIQRACRRRPLDTVDPLIDFVDLLTPDNIAQRLRSLGAECDAVAIIAADHPLIAQTIRDLRDQGTPTVTYITDQSSPDRAGFVGLDNWKVGRTAAWLMNQMTGSQGRVAVFNGNHRYQCQDVADAALRSYMREKAPDMLIEDTRATNEEPNRAYLMTKDLLVRRPDLNGIFIVGGGISGVLRAITELPEEKRQRIRLVCRDIGPETRKGLSAGLITAAICHPLKETSDVLVQTMIDACKPDATARAAQHTVPFNIVTPENI